MTLQEHLRILQQTRLAAGLVPHLTLVNDDNDGHFDAVRLTATDPADSQVDWHWNHENIPSATFGALTADPMATLEAVDEEIDTIIDLLGEPLVKLVSLLEVKSVFQGFVSGNGGGPNS